MYCQVYLYISAQCDNGSIRLTGGPNRFEGRVEVCVNGSWGQVCAMQWTRDDAQVVCRQLGQSTNNRELLPSYRRHIFNNQPVLLTVAQHVLSDVYA